MSTLTYRTASEARLHDILERASSSFFQGAAAALPVSLALTADQAKAAAFAALAGGITALLSLFRSALAGSEADVSASRNVVLRLAWTFAFAFVGTLPATFNLGDGAALVAMAQAGAAAGVAAIISLAKNLTATNVQANVIAARTASGQGR